MNTKMLTKIFTPLAAVSMLSGCLTLPKSSEYSIVNMPVISTEIKIDSVVNEAIAMQAITESLNEPTSVVGPFKQTLLGQYETNGTIVGIISNYERQGVTVKQNPSKKSVLNYTFYNAQWRHDSRSKEAPVLYPNYHTGAQNFLVFDVRIAHGSDGHNTYTISTSERGYTDVKTEYRQPLSLAQISQDVNERFDNLSVTIPWNREYSGEVTLKNDDVTAFANIQRNFKDSFVSTNDKTDSEKFGSFVLNNGQLVNFSLYPYKKTAKLQYNFVYDFSYDEKGGSTFEANYHSDTEKLIAREFNR